MRTQQWQEQQQQRKKEDLKTITSIKMCKLREKKSDSGN